MRSYSPTSLLPPLMLLILAAGVTFLSQTLFGQEGIRQERLFVITRNLNDNMVCYDVRVKDAKLDAKEPMKVYWIIPKNNNAVEDLTRIERKRAYGFEIVHTYRQDSLDIKLKPLPRKMRVKYRNGKWVAITTIDSVKAILTSAHVMADSNGIIPKVQWVRMTGVSLDHGTEVMEILKP